MLHYKCLCGHWTDYHGLNSGRSNGSKLEPCMVGRVNPLRCTKLKEEYQKRNAYWLRRDCPECEYQHKKRMAAMRLQVRDAAARLRAEFGCVESTRRGHMDVDFR